MEDCGFQILSLFLHLEISGTLSSRAPSEKQDFTAAVKSQDTIRFKCNRGREANSREITLNSKILFDLRELHSQGGIIPLTVARINKTVWVQMQGFG